MLAMHLGTARPRIGEFPAGGRTRPRVPFATVVVRHRNPVEGATASGAAHAHDAQGATVTIRRARISHERHVQLPGVWRRSRHAPHPHDTRPLGEERAASAGKALHLHTEQQNLGSLRRDVQRPLEDGQGLEVRRLVTATAPDFD